MTAATKSKRVSKSKSKIATLRTIRLVRLPGLHLEGKVEIRQDGEVAKYLFAPIPTEIGGRAFRVTKVEFVADALGEMEMVKGETYDVLLNGRESSCTCKWGTYGADRKPCRHVAGLEKLIAEGRLS